MFGLKIFPFFCTKAAHIILQAVYFPLLNSRLFQYSSTSMIRYSNSGKMPFHISYAAWSPIVFYHCQIFFILAGQLCLLIIFTDAKVNFKSVDESQTEKSKRGRGKQFLRIVQKYTSVPQEVVVNLSFWDKWTVPFCCVVFVSVSLPRIAFPHLLLFRGWWFLYLHHRHHHLYQVSSSSQDKKNTSSVAVIRSWDPIQKSFHLTWPRLRKPLEEKTEKITPWWGVVLLISPL